MSTVRAWLVEGPSGMQTPMTDRVSAAGYREMEGFTVTPLIAAPPAQTVEEVRAMIARFASLCVMAEHSSAAELEEADAIEGRLLSIVSCAAPPEGAPTYRELADAMVEVDAAEMAANECEECEGYRERAEASDAYCDTHSARVTTAMSTRARLTVALSRIPQQQVG
jgi:hypothetical protein